MDGFGFYYEEEDGQNLPAQDTPQQLGSLDEKLLKISNQNLNSDIEHQGPLIVVKSTVLSLTAEKVQITSSTCDGTIFSDGKVKCELSTAKRIDAMGDVDILRCHISESIESGGNVKISSLLCPLDLLTGDHVAVKNAEQINTVKGASALIEKSTVQKASLSEKGTFVEAKVLEEISGTACRIELIESTAKRIIFKKPYFIPGSERTSAVEASAECKAAAKDYKNSSILHPSAKHSPGLTKYIAILINSEVEEILFDELDGWCVEFIGKSKLSKVGALGPEGYRMYDITD